METIARDAYMEMQLVTAPPQKLRLMLIEGAIRFARQTLQCWETQQWELACEALIRCREIVSELLSSLKIEESPLAQQIGGIYTYLLRELTEAQRARDQDKLHEIISVLEIERDTWQLVCQRSVMEASGVPETGVPEKERAEGLRKTPRPDGLCLDA